MNLYDIYFIGLFDYYNIFRYGIIIDLFQLKQIFNNTNFFSDTKLDLDSINSIMFKIIKATF